MTFPVTIVDNFFDDPDAIVEVANNLKYFNPQGGHWPGTRTKNLHIDDSLLNKFAPKIVEGTKRLKAWVEST